MNQLFSFLVVGGAAWIFCVKVMEFPRKLALPWPPHRLGLENTEQTLYWTVIILVPLLSSLLAWALDKRWRPHARREITHKIIHPEIENNSRTGTWIKNFFFWIGLPILIFLMAPRTPPHASLDYLHTGIRMAPANQYLHGKIPYSEIFFGYGPGVEILQPLLAFRLWGQTLAAHRCLDWFIEPLGWVALYFFSLVLFQFKPSVLFYVLIQIK